MDSQQPTLIEAAIKDLLTRKLTALDTAVYMAAWREIYETTNTVDRRGGDRRSIQAKQAPKPQSKRFTLAAAEALGLSESTVGSLLRIVTNIPEDLRSKIADQPIADNVSELQKLAAEPPERQVLIAEMMSGTDPLVATFAEAKAILDGWPEPQAAAPQSLPLKEWLSPSEIAELGLIGHLRSGRAINAWIKTEKPFQDREFVRVRLGKGGGFEYHLFALLPYITDDDMRLRVGGMVAERMEIKRQLDRLAAEGIGKEPVRSASVKLDLRWIPTEELTSELMKRAGLLPQDRGKP